MLISSMPVSALFLLGGLALLVWSSDRFVDGAKGIARHLGVSPFVIGMIIVGFGTSLPEMLVSGLAAHDGNLGLALGNAYGSNIANIALILAVTALIKPIRVESQILRREMPILLAASVLAYLLVVDHNLSRGDAGGLLLFFLLLIGWSMREGMGKHDDLLVAEIEHELALQKEVSIGKSSWQALYGLVLLVAGSRLLVSGAVNIASALGVSDLVIGLTIVAIGTSLPELASSIVAIRKGEDEIAFGNIVGSNLFNTLAVVGIAGLVGPGQVPPDVSRRDLPVMIGLTLVLLIFSYGKQGHGRINRYEATALLIFFVAYTAWLIS